MAHEFEFDIDNPIDIHKAGLGAQEIKKTRAMFKERFDVDHNNSGVLDESASQDGTHKKLTLKALDEDPAAISGAGILYSKTVPETEDGEEVEKTDLYYRTTENIVRITNGGEISGEQNAYFIGSFTAEDDSSTVEEIVFDEYENSGMTYSGGVAIAVTVEGLYLICTNRISKIDIVNGATRTNAFNKNIINNHFPDISNNNLCDIFVAYLLEGDSIIASSTYDEDDVLSIVVSKI